jgi:predicted  nucleic acid-binding Zn-ribbon protein
VNTSIPPQDIQAQQQHLLKEKLKVHIKRELELGEKVISLLKQKKELEAHLQEQLSTKTDLEKKLAETATSRKTLEQEFLQLQRELQEKQKSLRKRSQRIAETEEGSKEDLKGLQQELAHLQQHLEILDTQKVTEQLKLSKKIKALSTQETHLKRALQQISSQKNEVEQELQDAMQKLQELGTLHDTQQKKYQQQIQVLQHERTDLETRISRLREEYQKNERKLLQEVESLKLSKVQLEEKVAQLKQQSTDEAQDRDAELLQVIEKQDRFIQELKEKAHQRSTMLRTENATLKQKLEDSVASHEKMTWESRMLESSFQGLQRDIVEYIQLKNQFEQAQHNKEPIEDALYQKITFFEERYVETQKTQQTLSPNHLQKDNRPSEQPLQPEPSSRAKSPVADEERKDRKPFHAVLNGLGAKFVLAVTTLCTLILAIAAYMQFPSYTVPTQSARVVLTLPEGLFEQAIPAGIEVFPVFGNAEQSQNHRETAAPSPVAAKKPEAPVEKPSPQPVKPVPTPVPRADTSDKMKAHNVEKLPTKEVGKPKKTQAKPPERPVEIVVQLPQLSGRLLPEKSPSFPTIENNIVLRRHYEQKLSTFRR